MSNNAIADISIDLIYPTQQKLKMLNKLRDTFRIQHQHNPNCLKMQVLCSPEPVPMLNATHFACKLNEYQFTINRMSNTCRLYRRREKAHGDQESCAVSWDVKAETAYAIFTFANAIFPNGFIVKSTWESSYTFKSKSVEGITHERYVAFAYKFVRL